MSTGTIFTIGHSTRSMRVFIELLEAWQVTAIADVRSAPWSKYNPQFNRPDLKASLEGADIHYRFFGRLLGGRPDRPDLYTKGVANYAAMAQTPPFAEGLALVVDGARKHRLALMCSEHDPIECHRCLLVGRELDVRGHDVQHIVSSTEARSQRDIEDRIFKLTGYDQHDFLSGGGDRLAEAYRDWSGRVAYAEKREMMLAQDIT